jgi:hypothetical protein
MVRVLEVRVLPVTGIIFILLPDILGITLTNTMRSMIWRMVIEAWAVGLKEAWSRYHFTQKLPTIQCMR